MSSLLIHSGTLVTTSGEEQKDLRIEDGVIWEIGEKLGVRGDETIDATNLLIFPGLIDCHVHFREPGMTQAEDMESGARAATAGGVTTVCEMPNTDPPTCTRQALHDKLKRAEHIRGCDIRFFFGVTKREHLEELQKVKREDIVGVKLYFGHSTGNQKVEEGMMEEVFRIAAERDMPVVCHCEDEEIIQKNMDSYVGAPRRGAPTDIGLHSAIRSVEAAVKATGYAIELARTYGTHLHIAHVSTGDELELIRKVKAEKLPVTCEVAPHHLFLTVEDYDSLGTLGKMNPPLRTREHMEALWGGIRDGTVDCLASDHAPHTLKAKQICHPERASESKDGVEGPLDAPSGVPGVETMLPLMLACVFGKGPRDGVGSVGARCNAPLQAGDLLRLLFTRPNAIFSLGKPGITPGKPVDLILVNRLANWTISGQTLHSRCGWTPYEGWNVRGKVVRVLG